MKKEELTFATELIQEAKRNSKRWFAIAIIELVILIATIAGFLYYISLPVEEITTEYTQDANTTGNDSPINQTIGE